jgi:filamentous hemagglutinin family protein
MGLLTRSQPVQAQIEPDNTLDPTPSILRNDTNTGQLLIEGGAPRSSTLFHSFSDFNIVTNGNAYFVNPDNINVIVSRVTGNRASNLLGTLGILGNADLFFINLNGIVFGPDSNLDLNGSFVASTANSVVFENGFVSSATTPAELPLLTVSTPTGLQFGQQPGPIGSLNLKVGHLFLDNGKLTVSTDAQGGGGAEISISDLDVLLLRNGSLIILDYRYGPDSGSPRLAKRYHWPGCLDSINNKI